MVNKNELLKKYKYIMDELEPLVSTDTCNDVLEKLEELEELKQESEQLKMDIWAGDI